MPNKTERRRTEPGEGLREVATVTSKGQITIPKAVRDRVGLQPGDQVAFVEDAGGMRIRRHRHGEPFKKWHGYLKDLKSADIDRMIDEMRGRS